MRVTNPRNIICSISGLREGSLSIDYFKDVKESEIFYKALENVAKKRGDLGSNYKNIMILFSQFLKAMNILIRNYYI